MLWIALHFPRLERAPATGHASLEQLAEWAMQFTSGVSLQAPCGLLLEIEGSLKRFGGIKKILTLIRRGAVELGHTPSAGVAPTVAAAWLLARAGCETIINCKRMIAAEIAPLPVCALDCDAKTLETLTTIGVKTVGEALQLPRDEATQCLGPQFFDQIDRILGVRPEARRFFEPPPRVSLEYEREAGDQALTLVIAAQRLLSQFSGYLAAR